MLTSQCTHISLGMVRCLFRSLYYKSHGYLESWLPRVMATCKAVMRPALEYASFIWSSITSSTSINKRQIMHNAALRTATGCTQDTNIQHLHDETLILSIHEHLQLHASQYKQKHNIHHTPYINIQHASTLQC